MPRWLVLSLPSLFDLCFNPAQSLQPPMKLSSLSQLLAAPAPAVAGLLLFSPVDAVQAQTRGSQLFNGDISLNQSIKGFLGGLLGESAGGGIVGAILRNFYKMKEQMEDIDRKLNEFDEKRKSEKEHILERLDHVKDGLMGEIKNRCSK